MQDGMSCGRQYAVASDLKGAGEKWYSTKFEMKMRHPVREDLLRYLQSNLQQSIQNNTQELKAI